MNFHLFWLLDFKHLKSQKVLWRNPVFAADGPEAIHSQQAQATAILREQKPKRHYIINLNIQEYIYSNSKLRNE